MNGILENLAVKYALSAILTIFNLVVQNRNCPQEAWPNLSGAGPTSQGSGSQVYQGDVVYQPEKSKLPIIITQVGEPGDGRQWRYVMLQRSRREHYNLLVSQLGTSKLAVFKLEEVSEKIRQLWRI